MGTEADGGDSTVSFFYECVSMIFGIKNAFYIMDSIMSERAYA